MPADARQLVSCLYRGQVVHRRWQPFRHEFRYPLFQLYLDLSEIDQVFEGRWLWSASRRAPARFRRDDHLGDPRQPLRDAVLDVVEERLGIRPAGPVRLLTHLRYWGYVMNPLSLFYCFEPDGHSLAAIVAEVSNTPWGERHSYVLDGRARNEDGVLETSHAKEFHVSPFLPMEVQYHWRVATPGEHLAVTIATEDKEGHTFDAALALQRSPLTTGNLARTLACHPWMTGRVVTAIYWQALLLWWKGATFFPHPPAREYLSQDQPLTSPIAR